MRPGACRASSASIPSSPGAFRRKSSPPTSTSRRKRSRASSTPTAPGCGPGFEFCNGPRDKRPEKEKKREGSHEAHQLLREEDAELALRHEHRLAERRLRVVAEH